MTPIANDAAAEKAIVNSNVGALSDSVAGVWSCFASTRFHAVQRPDGEQNAERRGDHTEHRRLEEKLANQHCTRRAKRKAPGDFLVPRRESSEEQVRHIRAGDEQHESDGREEHDEGGAYRAHQFLDPRAELVFRVRIEASGERLFVVFEIAPIAASAAFAKVTPGFEPRRHLQVAGAPFQLHVSVR